MLLMDRFYQTHLTIIKRRFCMLDFYFKSTHKLVYITKIKFLKSEIFFLNFNWGTISIFFKINFYFIINKKKISHARFIVLTLQ